MVNSGDKIKDIKMNFGTFEDGTTDLDEFLLHQSHQLKSFYSGELPIDVARGEKVREVSVKTHLHKPVLLIYKVVGYVETQTFYVVSPRKIIMHSRLKTDKAFYGDHYYVDILYHFDEKLIDGQPCTTLELKCSLVFTKTTPLIQKKVKEYYDTNLLESFNTYLKPNLIKWIQSERLDQPKDKKL